MENQTIAPNDLLTSLKQFGHNRTEHSTIKTLLKNFLYSDMAIKDNACVEKDYACVVPMKPAISISDRMKAINEAKQAFLYSTVNSAATFMNEDSKKEQPATLHYAQLAITSESGDARSTGGGGNENIRKHLTNHNHVTSIAIAPIIKKKIESQHRKVSFKIKNAASSYRRPPVATTKTMTITTNKVSELTKKYNDLVNESHGSNATLTKSKIVKTIEDIQKSSPSTNSTPTSTLNSSPNIKIVVRQRRTSKKRYSSRKRCSSADSIEKFGSPDSESEKSKVIRSKSDGTRAPKSSKKKLKFPDSDSKSVDKVDGKITESEKSKSPETSNTPLVVKNVIKKFECEIIAKSNTDTLRKSCLSTSSSSIISKEKPKVPEKKRSIVLTKNVVVKDGTLKFKSVKQQPEVLKTTLENEETKPEVLNIPQRKESFYEKKKFKTNYIFSEKKPLQIVDIIPEDLSDSNNDMLNNTKPTIILLSDNPLRPTTLNIAKDSQVYEDFENDMVPNESFLWRRKSTSIASPDSEKSILDGSYSILSLTPSIKSSLNVTDISTNNLKNEDTICLTNEQNISSNVSDLDFESNLVEAYNKEVIIGYTTKVVIQQSKEENDYESFEPIDVSDEVRVSIRSADRSSKINCPLPEIPKIHLDEKRPENVYQSLIEMRSHPEGDENNLHNYETCNMRPTERTRGDGDSDDGYEYCKSPIKPYCISTNESLKISDNNHHTKTNYEIEKSVSTASTESYEKIGSDRIYEKIVLRPKQKDSTLNSQCSRSSYLSDYSNYNDGENIYDSIKHGDEISLSHCYESIPNSPSLVKQRLDLRNKLSTRIQKRLSFDTMSNISQSTISSEQKTNSIYGQRSIMSYNGQEMTFQVPSSETSVSDRSDDWVDVSDEEKTEEQKIVIVHERSRGRKSPISWSQKVRHQWLKAPKTKGENQGDSSDSGHVYESLEPAVAPPVPLPAPEPIEEDFDSFDSDSDIETNYENKHYVKSTDPITPVTNLERLPEPPSGGGGNYTLTKIASAAQRKMRQLKRNLTKKYSEAIDGKTFQKFTSQNNWNDSKNKANSPIYENCEKPVIQHQHIYSNFNIEHNPVKIENGSAKPNGNTDNNIKDEIKIVLGDKKIYGELPPPLPDKPPPEKPTTPTSDSKKDIGSLSRKTYLSFKSRFRRASSMAVDINEVPSALKITNSTFYLTDSMDGDSGFSNCSDSAQPTAAGGSSEALPTSPAGLSRRRDGNRRIISESTPCLAPVDRSPLAPPDRSFLAPSDRMIAPLERPSLPPPPPPPLGADLAAVNEELKRLLPTLSRKDKGIRTRTSWYAECGALEETSTPSSSRPSSTSWYAEAGLLQAGNISSSSGASSGSHPASPLPHSLFTHEPLYQFYNAAKLESVCRETTDSDSDAYESTPFTKRPSLPADNEGADSGGSGSSVSGGSVSAGSRPSAMALVAPRGPARTLWCEVPEVVNSAVLSSLVPAQKRLQEAKFELLTSEASYLNSLNVLEAHFIAHPAFREPTILPRADREALFSTILPVRKCSQILMVELEKCWQENILLQGICDIVRRHAEKHFHVYVKYCEHQGLMVKALQRLRERPTFAMALKRLESHPACQSLSLHSFLMLPMQRITRLPLLMDAVLKNLGEGDVEHQSCMDALATLNSFVSQCNEGARNTERIEEMYRLSQVIEFPATMSNPPSLAPACGRRDRRPIRWLVRSGEMTQLLWKTDEIKLTFGKKYHKVPLHLFLFNDILVITKKKSENSYMTVDYCARSLLEVCSADVTAHAKHTLLLTLLENHLGKTVEMLMSCESETDVSRWSEALCPPTAADGETVYGGWDCPQVAALYAYGAAQPDELTLTEGDIVNVTRKTSEGWYYGERIRDGETGWFPGAYTVEIASPHVRARNLRQRYRLLALSGTYLGQKKKT